MYCINVCVPKYKRLKPENIFTQYTSHTQTHTIPIYNKIPKKEGKDPYGTKLFHITIERKLYTHIYIPIYIRVGTCLCVLMYLIIYYLGSYYIEFSRGDSI